MGRRARAIAVFAVALVGCATVRALPSPEAGGWVLLGIVGLAAGLVSGRPAQAWIALGAYALAEASMDLATGASLGAFWFLVVAGRLVVVFVAFVAGATVRPASGPPDSPQPSRRWPVAAVVVALVTLLPLAGYGGYAMVRSAEYLDMSGEGDCRTPAVAYGWAYEAINYDKADDAPLIARHPDPRNCFVGNPKDRIPDQGAEAGTEVVSSDGIHVAGWYIAAGDGAPPSGPTLILVHGGGSNKSGMLKYAAPLHADYNLVLIDLRNQGRSTGKASSGGILEARDLRAMIDWLIQTKHPSWLAIVGNSYGAATTLVEAMDDARPQAFVLDSVHASVVTQVGNVFENEEHVPAWPAAWGFVTGASLRLGADITAADPERTIGRIGDRPALLTQGLKDQVDRPVDALEPNIAAAMAAGVHLEVHVCPTAGHGRVVADQPPPTGEQACTSDWGTWVRDFLDRTRGLAAS